MSKAQVESHQESFMAKKSRICVFGFLLGSQTPEQCQRWVPSHEVGLKFNVLKWVATPIMCVPLLHQISLQAGDLQVSGFVSG